MKKFPKDFLWGTAVSAYQVEGGNSNSDWWKWEQEGKTTDKSGRACDYYNRFKADHNLLEELGCNTFRLSVEWARVEPNDGEFSDKEFEHYREILSDLKKRGIKVQLTLWWWTSPIWFQDKYKFCNNSSVKIFTRYVEKTVDELGDLVDMWQVLNEPMVPLGQGYLGGVFPPGLKNPWKFWKALNNIAKSYNAAYEIIKIKYPDIPVGASYLYNWYESANLGFLIKIISRVSRWFRIDLLDKKIGKNLDFLGVQYYGSGKINFNWKYL